MGCRKRNIASLLRVLEHRGEIASLACFGGRVLLRFFLGSRVRFFGDLETCVDLRRTTILDLRSDRGERQVRSLKRVLIDLIFDEAV